MADPSRMLYLIDGHGQIFRAYFAIRGGMNSPVTGEPSQAVFAFAGMMLKFLSTMKPQYAVMAIDTPGKTFRDEMYDQYKANRPPPPADFHSQEQRIFEMTRMFGVPILGQTGAEADDIIATLTRRILDDPRFADFSVRIVSKDKDLEQLLCDRVTMFDIHTDTTIDLDWLKANKGITPAQVVDMLALMGDSVDNVPGVEGIGPKTAAELISRFGNLDTLLANLDQLKGKRRENLAKSREILALSRRLVQLKSDLDLPFDLDRAQLRPPDAQGLKQLFHQMGFRRHQSELDRLLGLDAASTQTPVIATTRPASPAVVAKGDTGLLFADSLFDSAPAPSVDVAAAAVVSAVPYAAADHDYQAITTVAQMDELVAELRRQKLIALDTETIGLGHRAKLCGLSLAWKKGHAVYVPVVSPEPAQHLDLATVQAKLGPVLADRSIGKCGHNLQYDYLVLRHAGFDVQGIEFDSMIASHLLDLPGHGLDHLAESLLNHRMMQISEVLGAVDQRGRSNKTMDQAPLAIITRYAADDAEVTYQLHDLLQARLRLLGLEELSQKVEMPLVQVLAEMEFAGIRLDRDILAQQKEELAKRIIELRDRIHETVGGPFNVDSPKQLAEVLFSRLKLPVGRRTRTGPSTDSEVLEKLAEMEGLTAQQAAVPGLILEYRQLTKLVNTYLQALADSIDPATGRVHARFHQTGAATGRLSSSDPNLQNIPIRTPIGRRIRQAFVAEPGHLLISADYSQIELRVLAHLSQDPALIAAFLADQDIHAAVASQVFGVPLDQVSKEQRDHAKVINFGIVYGVTPYGLARRIEGLDLDRARQLISDYKRRFAGIDRFLDQCIQQAEQLGYVTTIMNRRRSIGAIKSANANQRALGERLAINSVVQGSAADLIKLAMVNLYRRIESQRLPMKLLLQIHDELVLEAPADQAQAMAQVVKEEMEGAMSLRVPLKVEAGVGSDWLECK